MWATWGIMTLRLWPALPSLAHIPPEQVAHFTGIRNKTVYVKHYYSYIDDADFGPLFLKVCSYAPWGIKLCLNGHEWAKRQLQRRGIGYEALDNGFLSCGEPEELQRICDALGPEDIDGVFRKWLKRIPLPLRPQDREAGYDWALSIWQMEVSLTQIRKAVYRGVSSRPRISVDRSAE